MILNVIRREGSELPELISKRVGQHLVGMRFRHIELDHTDLAELLTEKGIAWATKELLPSLRNRRSRYDNDAFVPNFGDVLKKSNYGSDWAVAEYDDCDHDWLGEYTYCWKCDKLKALDVDNNRN